jgi:hypothetical protein
MWWQLSWVCKQSGDLTLNAFMRKSLWTLLLLSPRTMSHFIRQIRRTNAIAYCIIVASHENTIFALGPENSLSTCKIQTKHCKVAATKVKVFIAKLKLKAKICFHIKSWEDLCVPTCYQDLFPTYKENRTGLIRCDTTKMKRTDLANLAVHNWPKMRKMRPVKGCY